MQTKAFNHPIQRFHRTHRTPFRLLLTCAALVISGCSAKQPVIYAIAPDLCTRHQVSVGDLIVTYELGIARLYPWREVESGTLYYRGIEGPNIVKLHPNPNNNLTKYVYYVPLDDVNNDYSYDGTNIAPGGRMGAHDYNKIGEDGEAYILWDGFYLVVYSASPEELDYALQASRATWSSWEPVPCPEP